MGRLFTGIRAPSTLGTFLRTFTFGQVRQLDAVASRFVIALAKNAPILPGSIGVNGNRKLTSFRQLNFDHLRGHCSSVVVVGTRPRSRSLSR